MGVKKIVASTCNECKREYPIENFYEAKGKFMPNKVVLYCKDCCNDMFKEYLKKTGSVESAMWYLCAKLDIPFIKKVFQRTESQVKVYQKNSEKDDEEYNWILYYMNFLWGSQSLMKPKEEWLNFTDTDVALGDITRLKKSELAIEQEMEDLRLIWGREKTVEQLQYLEFQWEKYVGNKYLTDYQESVYKDLCMAELDIYEGNEIDKAIKRKGDCAKILGLDNFEIDKEKSTVEKMLESQITTMEQEEPAFYYKDLEKYADFMGIGNYWLNHIIRPIKNVLLNQKEYKIVPDDEDKKEEK